MLYQLPPLGKTGPPRDETPRLGRLCPVLAGCRQTEGFDFHPGLAYIGPDPAGA
jgi:hypothetical protein